MSTVTSLSSMISSLPSPDDERALLRPMDEQDELPVSLEAIKGRQHLRRNADGEVMVKFEAGMFDISSPVPSWRLFDPADRSHALTKKVRRLSLFSLAPSRFTRSPIRLIRRCPEVGAPAPTVRAMGRFCADDHRLLAGGYVPLSLGPEVAGELLDEAFADGCFTVMVDTNEADPEALSFTHPEFDPVWARFAARDVPVIFTSP